MAEEQQRVAKRKTHKKSRKGCFQCKQRHTKCNESKPRCANCVRLDIDCTWPTVTNVHAATPTQSPASQPSPVADSRPLSGLDPIPRGIFDLSIPDMRLLHFWSVSGYKALHPLLAKRSNVWQVAVIELAFEHPFLLHGILALAAVHKASFLLPTERQGLLVQADGHISQALEYMRRYLEAPNFDTSVPMFVLSSVFLTYNFGSAQEMPEDPIGSLHHCFMLLNGIKVVIGPFWEATQNNPVLSQIVEISTPATYEALAMLAKDDRRPEILGLMDLTELVLDTQDKQACVESINELHQIAVSVKYIDPDRDDHPFLFHWPARVSKRFFDLLSAHNPVACIITIHFAVLLVEVRPVWWIVKWPRYLLAASEQLLAPTPDLLSWLDWPRKVISVAPWHTISTHDSG